MAANSTLRVSELDFNEIRANLKDFLRGRPEFTDYDFDGSGMSVLIDLLAYNTHYMAYHLNMIGNEMFLDSAQLRESLISHAKLMNYVPTSRIGSKAKLNITITPGSSEDNDVQSITLSRGTNFLSEPINGISYNFVTLNSNTTIKSNNTFNFSNIVISQGEFMSINYIVDSSNDKRQYMIPSANVDTSTIEVMIQESTVNTYSETYTLATDLTEINSNSKIYFLEESAFSNNSYMLYFGDDVIGKKPKNGNIVKISYLDTQGYFSNHANTFTIIDDIDSFSANVIIETTQKSFSGSEKESKEQIRFRAPKFHTAQNRMVTKNDYKILILKDYPNIQSVEVWGGEENNPPEYGTIFISLNPVNNYSISLEEKEKIKNEIVKNKSVMTVIPKFVDPDYVYLLFKINVDFNSNLSVLSQNDIRELIKLSIDDYSNECMNKFDTTFRLSKLETKLNSLDVSILGVATDIFLQKRIKIDLNIAKTYEINFNIPLLKGSFQDNLYTYPAVSVLDNDNVEREVFFEEVPQSFTGVDSIKIINPGSGYTETPIITITGDGVGASAIAKIVNGKISEITVTNKGIGYTRALISISGNAQLEAVLEFNNGIIRSFYYKNTGEKIIVNPISGNINYKEGKLTLNNLKIISIKENDSYDEDILTVNIQPEIHNILPKRNQILTIDLNDNQSIKTIVNNTNDTNN